MSALAETDFDLVIIGTGGAGIAASLEAKRNGLSFVVLSKGAFADSKTSRAQGGIQAAIGDEDSPKIHFEDTLKAGNYKNDKKLVSTLVNKAESTINWLVDLGVEFDKEGNSFKLSKGAGISFPRVLSCGDSTGNRIINPLKKRVQEEDINVWEHSAVLSINRQLDNSFSLRIRRNLSSEITVSSLAIVIATGGILPLEKRAGLAMSKNELSIPDGIDLAGQIGARVESPELMQYHPTGVISPKLLRRQRLPETMRGAGARLLNKDLAEFANSLLWRNALSNAIVQECVNGRGISTEDGRTGVWLNTPDIDAINGDGYLRANFSKFYNLFMNEDHDISKRPVLVYPIVHYSLGGICIDEHGATSVKGVYAAGETTYGVHGEDRLMGNSLLDIFVFGRIAGNSVAKYIKERYL